MSEQKKRFRVLSLDGGGVRGLFTAVILNRLQSLCGGRHPSEVFDLMVGTSTGAIIIAVLSAVDENGKPKYNCQDVVDIYQNDSTQVFSASMWKNLTSIYGVYGARFSTVMRDKLFEKYIGDMMLSQTACDVVIPTFDMCAKQPAFFKTRKARIDPNMDDHRLQDVVKGALAAPTIFPPHQIKDRLYMDALYGKNPTMFAITEAVKHYGVSLDDLDILSIGTGYTDDGNAESIQKTVQSGVPFLMEVFNSTINGNTVSTQYMAEQMLPRRGDQILRVDSLIEPKHMGICDVTPNNLRYLRQRADTYVSVNLDRLVGFACRLIGSDEVRLDGLVDVLPPLPEDDATEEDDEELALDKGTSSSALTT